MADSTISKRPTVAERLRAVRGSLTQSEIAVANELMANYPISGLVPIVQLAAAAKVSAPTVTRLISKLGYNGFAEFHARLREELKTRMFSPVDAYPVAEGTEDDPIQRAMARYGTAMGATFQGLDAGDLQGAVRALADPAADVAVLGGRYSHVLASHLVSYLTLLRPGVSLVADQSGARMAALVDITEASVAVVFDFRRYQATSVEWGEAAVQRGARLIVVTDQFLTPLSSSATALLSANSTGLDPFDSMVGPMAVTEFLIAEVARLLGDEARQRLADFEALQIATEAARPRRG